MAIDISGAEAYFSKRNHIKSEIWAAFDEDSKYAALTHAQRIIEALCEDFDDTTSSAGDFPRYDLAVYEQACYMLQCSPVQADANKAGPKFSMPDVNQKQSLRATPSNPYALCGEALRWLVTGGCIELSRG